MKKMKTVHEVSRFTGVSVRTLHHYDAIGLLKPAEVTEAGYRLYDDAALGRLQIILMFRELRFPLKEIKKIMDSPDFDRKEALAQQIRLLELQREHIGGLIAFAREIQEKGVEKMNFDAFWNEEMEQYAEEVRERWGTTDAYKEFEEKRKGKGDGDYQIARKEMQTLFAELGTLRCISSRNMIRGRCPHPASGIRLGISGNTANADGIRYGWNVFHKVRRSSFFFLQVPGEPLSIRDDHLVQYLVPVSVTLCPSFDHIPAGKIEYLFQYMEITICRQ